MQRLTRMAAKWQPRLQWAASKSVQLGKVVSVRGPERAKAFMYYAKVELAPPNVADFAAVRTEFKKMGEMLNGNGTFSNLTMKRVFQNLAIALETYVIFSFGEILGRRSLIGYNPMGDKLREVKPPPGMTMVLPDFVTYLELNTMYDNGLYHFGPGKNY